jgi:rhodanese-related sulfurtransferase
MQIKKGTMLLLGIICFFQVTAQSGVLSPTQFQQQVIAGQSQLLDVRTAGEYKQGHLSNALQADWTNSAEFAERVKYLDKNKPLLVYCASGGRSGQAAEWLVKQGFVKVDNLTGGMIAWKQASLPFVTEEVTRQMSAEAYAKLIRSAGVVLVDFGAEWCPPCKKMEPVLASLQKELAGKYTLVKVDGGRDTDMMKANGVNALPVFIVYKNGKETYRIQGVVEKNILKAQLQ